MKQWISFAFVFSLIISISGCTQNQNITTTTLGGVSMELKSPAFENQGNIPEKYSCDGEDINPPLEISDVPDGTESLVLIVDDPDAPMGTFDHWIIWNIPVQNKIEENSVPEGSVQGKNGFGNNEYGGPCPPGEEHRYYFKLYALDTSLDLPEGSSKQEVENAMQDHVLGQAQLMGKYAR